MSGSQQLGLLANLPRMQAQQRIKAGKFGGLDHTGVYNLYLLAFEDEQIASQARTQFLQATIDRDCDAVMQRRANQR